MELKTHFPVISGGVMSFPCVICGKETKTAYTPYRDGKYWGRWPYCEEHSEDELYKKINNMLEVNHTLPIVEQLKALSPEDVKTWWRKNMKHYMGNKEVKDFIEPYLD